MKRLLLIPLAVILASALIFGGCKPAAEVPEEILIGSSTALTGKECSFAIGGTFGVETALEDINDLGGVYVEEYGKKLHVSLIITDNESEATKAGTLAEDLITRDKIQVLVTAGCPQPLSTPISTVCERYEVPYVGAAGLFEQFVALRESVTPPWKQSWDISFAVATPPPPGSVWDKPGMTMSDMGVAWLLSIADRNNKRVAMYATDDVDGRGWYEGTPFMLEAAGYEAYGTDRGLGLFPSGATDFSPIIQEWIEGDCDILIGNAPGPDAGVLLRQCRAFNYEPKGIWDTKAAIFYQNIAAWGGNIPHGVCTERFWYPTYDPEFCPGIGGRTPQTLADYWGEKTGEPLSPSIGLGYCCAQVVLDAIERAGSLDAEDINAALAETNLPTINYPMAFDENQFARYPMHMDQWRAVDSPEKWECPIVFAPQEYMGEPAELIFPITYD